MTAHIAHFPSAHAFGARSIDAHCSAPRFSNTRRALLALAGLSLAAILPAAPAKAAELVMFETQWCGRCKQFLAEAAPSYRASPAGHAAPLRVIDMQRTAPWFATREPIQGTPTFVLVDRGRELGRITGYTSREAFLAQSQSMIAQLPSRARVKRPRTRVARAATSSQSATR